MKWVEREVLYLIVPIAGASRIAAEYPVSTCTLPQFVLDIPPGSSPFPLLSNNESMNIQARSP